MHRLAAEVMQRDDPTDDCGQRGWNFDIPRVGAMDRAVHPIFMNLSSKGGFDLACRAAKDHLTPALSDRFDFKALILEPSDHLVQIMIGNTELTSEIFGSEPLV